MNAAWIANGTRETGMTDINDVSGLEFIHEIKHSEGKLPLGLVPPDIDVWVAEVLQYGANQYEPDSWKNPKLGMAPCKGEIMSAALRHICNYRYGVINDGDSGLHHLKHAIVNLMFLVWHETRDAKLGG